MSEEPTKRPIIKICGLKTIDALEASIEGGADLAGFVFFEKSPRHLTLDVANTLAARAAGRIKQGRAHGGRGRRSAGCDHRRACNPSICNFTGRETPERVREAKARFKLPVIKAIGVGAAEDLVAARAYGEADMLLYDAKPSPAATRPGGLGLAFDWSLLSAAPRGRPWLLSGGLTPDTVAEALRATGAPGVDVSSGVESAPGQKDRSLIAAFLRAVRAASPEPR